MRTEITKGADLVNGEAWIAEFHRRLGEAQSASAAQPGRRRLLRQVATEGDNPQYWGSAGDAPMVVRNEVLKQMGQVGEPGRKVKLPDGQDVIFWFNVGPPGPPRERVYVTEAYCPHQQVCLAEGELRDIEDVVGARRPMVRCPRHNKMFDLRTGESPGNTETLRRFPCRFERGHWYVGLPAPPTLHPPTPALSAGLATGLAGIPTGCRGCPTQEVVQSVASPQNALMAHPGVNPVGADEVGGGDVEMEDTSGVVFTPTKRQRVLAHHMTVP